MTRARLSRRRPFGWLGAALVAILAVAAAREARAGDILVFAAASPTNAIEEVVGLYQAK